ncbi:four helix bundle protein [Opitutus sp. GAS368]|jgi:four helix bundle protein|uniref:four helix bundle protein n=1 Tax=Opitutus sp. GAS368 TaxID=1882749 RepID=UPI00087A49D4|nr:four helix bundle protein [Opitutus sp. GAS368]SDR65422.1 four helix bundle protein [Opitutus sp. GAS368]
MEKKPVDLEERTALFAENVRKFVRQLPRTIANIEDVKQLVRASGSVAANCIEVNEALGNKDRVMRFRISRKEAKECQLWLRLVNVGDNPEIDTARKILRQEAHELKLIFTSIIKKLE